MHPEEDGLAGHVPSAVTTECYMGGVPQIRVIGVILPCTGGYIGIGRV